jgi:glycyl-tRNA synthetase beta chain
MAELLLELFSEEIPARMQRRAALQLAEKLEAALKQHDLPYTHVAAHATPRRLVVMAEGLPESQEAKSEERRGPKVGAPGKAIEGFLKATGFSSVDELEVRAKGKDEYYFATVTRQAVRTEILLAESIVEILEKFNWPTSMRWGGHAIRWVRPLRSILCLFNGEVVPLCFGHLEAGNVTYGHRFMAPKPIEIESIAGYKAAMEKAKVMLSLDDRKEVILNGAKASAKELNGQLVDDAGLLEEVAGLVEWPVVLSGTFDKSFLTLPREVLVTAMRSHQKYFTVETEHGQLIPGFVFVSNMDAKDGGKGIVAGNERVLKARLADARFFWEQDRQVPLDDWAEKLSGMVFHAKLGTMEDKVRRIEGLAKFLAVWVPHANLLEVERAAQLCKADLTTDMVDEFPELQGLMGRYYALEQGEESAVADAIRDHYAPQGPADACPKAPASVAIALADKLDSLCAMFAIDERPTGSKDPYALRRAALGVIRLILENGLRVPLRLSIDKALTGLPTALFKEPDDEGRKKAKRKEALVEELFTFIVERLKVMMRDEGYGHDQIAAVFADGQEDDLVRAVLRVRSLKGLLTSVEGERLLEAYRRAANIVRAEEKKDDATYQGKSDASLVRLPEEAALLEQLKLVRKEVQKHVKEEQFDEACSKLASLREPVDAFFERVTVNDNDPSLRKNRLLLLSGIRSSMDMVVDFSALEG